jgi:pimeloyl-ACP methyl ester carboxylesterase
MLATRYHVFGMLLRPLWPRSEPSTIQDWKPFSEDLLELLHQAAGTSVIGLGHSIGAVVALRAALLDPSLFRALVLIDPVLAPPHRILQMHLKRILGVRWGTKSMVEGASRRRRRFDDLEQLFAGYRRRDVFRFFSDEGLRVLVKGITRQSADGGYELVYSPEWEARIYETGLWNDWDLWDGIRKLEVPTLFLRGSQTDTFFASTSEMIRRKSPAVVTQTIPEATHLVPMERPGEVAEAVRQFVDSLGFERSSVHIPRPTGKDQNA